MKDKCLSLLRNTGTKPLLKNNSCQTLSININATMGSVHNAFHYMDMTGYKTFCFFKILSFRMRKSAECVRTLCFSNRPIQRNHKSTYQVNVLAKKCSHNVTLLKNIYTASTWQTSDHRSMFLLTEHNSTLSFMLSLGPPQTSVNQNNE